MAKIMKILVAIVMSFFVTVGCSNSRFYSVPNQLVSNQTVSVPDIQFLNSKSGNTLAYRWYKTTGKSKGSIIHFHGNSTDISESSEKVSWLSEHGFNVFVFDYSGFGYSTGKATDSNLYNDAVSVLNAISALRSERQKPVFVIATSMGGNIFLRALADNYTQIDGIVIDSSFSSYREMAQYTFAKYPFSYLTSWLLKVFIRDDYSFSSAGVKIAPARILVAHCIRDDVVPIEYGRKLFTLLNGSKEFWQLDNCQHARTFTSDNPLYQKKLLSWLTASVASDDVE